MFLGLALRHPHSRVVGARGPVGSSSPALDGVSMAISADGMPVSPIRRGAWVRVPVCALMTGLAALLGPGVARGATIP